MIIPLRQSTAINVDIGQFVDNIDGYTAETALTIAQADVRLSKGHGTWAQKNDATTCTHKENGFYSCPLNTTDTNTAGLLKLFVTKSGALPVEIDFWVFTALVYDSLFAGSDNLQVDLTQWLGSAPNTLISGRPDVNVQAMATALDSYDAKIWLLDDNSGGFDRYLVVWYLNGQPVVSGITSPTLRVVNAATGSDLIAASAMTEIGTLGIFRLDNNSTRVANGTNYIARAQATIGGSTRTSWQPVGRDSA